MTTLQMMSWRQLHPFKVSSIKFVIYWKLVKGYNYCTLKLNDKKKFSKKINVNLNLITRMFVYGLQLA